MNTDLVYYKLLSASYEKALIRIMGSSWLVDL